MWSFWYSGWKSYKDIDFGAIDEPRALCGSDAINPQIYGVEASQDNDSQKRRVGIGMQM